MRLHEEFGALGVGRHDLWSPEGAGLLGCKRQTEGLQAGRRSHGGRSKKLRRACGGSPRETCLGHTGRGMDPGRDRVGQKNKLTYRLARKGSRPRASHDQRTQSTYLFGAVCPQNAEPVSPSRCL